MAKVQPVSRKPRPKETAPPDSDTTTSTAVTKSKKPPHTPADQLEARKKKMLLVSKRFEDEAAAFRITNPETCTTGRAIIARCTDHIKEMETWARPRIAEANALHKGLTGDLKLLIAGPKAAKAILSGKLATYDKEQDRLRQELADKQRAEAEAARAAEVEELEDDGDLDAADSLEEAPLLPLPPVPARAKPQDGVRATVTWKAREIDASKTPRKFLQPNLTAINAEARTQKKDFEVEGWEAYADTTYN